MKSYSEMIEHAANLYVGHEEFIAAWGCDKYEKRELHEYEKGFYTAIELMFSEETSDEMQVVRDIRKKIKELKEEAL